MKTFRVVPQISCCDTFREFADHFQVGNGDILVTNRRRYEKYVKPAGVAIPVLFREDYGKGEPTDEMIDAMGRDMEQYDAKRIIAFGGGTIVDMCKVLALDLPERSQMLFTGDAAPKKIRELIIIPTTCGTGSEVTNVTISELKSLHVKKGNLCGSCSIYPGILAGSAGLCICDKFHRCADPFSGKFSFSESVVL